jgi:hypothetical protein
MGVNFLYSKQIDIELFASDCNRTFSVGVLNLNKCVMKRQTEKWVRILWLLK